MRFAGEGATLTIRHRCVEKERVDVTIEPMTTVDWPGVMGVWREGIATGHTTFTPEPAATFEKFCEGKFAAGRLVARSGAGEVVGWTSLGKVSTREVYAGVAELSIAVAAVARGQGVGRALMQELIVRSEAAGVWMLQSVIFPENTASLALHDRFGFRLVGRRERIGKMPAIGPRAGEWRDTLLLERRSAVTGL
jgi:phosphinothricin acetyltransferase